MKLLLPALLLSFLVCGCGDGGGADDDDDTVPTGDCPYFPAGSIYCRDISDVAPVENSAAITSFMEGQHPPNGWGTGEMKLDFAILVNRAPAGTEKRPFEIVEDYYFPPECDLAPVPLPRGGAAEVNWEVPTDLSGDFTGYDCSGFDDGADCHVLVYAPDEQRLYEIYHATVRADGTFLAGCEAIWDTSRPADAAGRGQQCTSADAAGYAIAPLLVTPEEVAAGEIHHAVRLILPGDMIRGGVYYPPATHGTDTDGPADSLPYGGRMRLRSDYPIDQLSPPAQVIARAMQRYGMMLADGGNIAITAGSDLFSERSWADLGLEPDALAALKASDFDVIVEGDPVATGSSDCQRTPIEN